MNNDGVGYNRSHYAYAECKLCGENILLPVGDIGAKFTLLQHLVREHPNQGNRVSKKLLTDESKANEENMFPDQKGKTYTCEYCGKVGTDFVEMSKEICPDNPPAGQNGHAIPIFGDMQVRESKASEYSIYDQTNPNRDLSDPNWISVGAHRAERSARMELQQNMRDTPNIPQYAESTTYISCPLCDKVFVYKTVGDEFGNTTKWADHMSNEHSKEWDSDQGRYRYNMIIRELKAGDVVVESKANEDLNEDGGFNTDQDHYDPVGVRYSERAWEWLEEIIDSKAFDGTLESLKTLGKKAGFNETDKQWNDLLSDWKAEQGIESIANEMARNTMNTDDDRSISGSGGVMTDYTSAQRYSMGAQHGFDYCCYPNGDISASFCSDSLDEAKRYADSKQEFVVDFSTAGGGGGESKVAYNPYDLNVPNEFGGQGGYYGESLANEKITTRFENGIVYHTSELGGTIKHPEDVWCGSCDNINESKANESLTDNDKHGLRDWVNQNPDWTTIDDLPNELFMQLVSPAGDDIDKRVEIQQDAIKYMMLVSYDDFGVESKATEELTQCPTCDGLGTTWTDTAYDEGYSDLCPTCSGRGMISTTSRIRESKPSEVWCDINGQWEDEDLHKEHIRKQFGENEDDVDWEEEFKKQAKDRGYGDALDSGQLSITTLPSDFLNPKKKKGSKANENEIEEWWQDYDDKDSIVQGFSSWQSSNEPYEDAHDWYQKGAYGDSEFWNDIPAEWKAKIAHQFYSQGTIMDQDIWNTSTNESKANEDVYDYHDESYIREAQAYLKQLMDSSESGFSIIDRLMEKFSKLDYEDAKELIEEREEMYKVGESIANEVGLGDIAHAITDPYNDNPSSDPSTGIDSVIGGDDYSPEETNEVDNSMDLGLLSGGIPEVNATNNEQCEVCGQLIDQDLMDYHVEQEHGLHVPSQYTQGTISQAMGDPDYDHLEDWRTAYGENKKVANEGMAECPHCDGEGKIDVDWTDSGIAQCPACNGSGKMDKKLADDYIQNDMDQTSRARSNMYGDDEYIDGSDVPTSGFYESKANEDDDEYYEYDDDGTQLNPVEYDDDEWIDDSDVPKSGNYESKAKKKKDKKYNEWKTRSLNIFESEGEDEPEYYDDIPEDVASADNEEEGDYADRKEKEKWMTDESSGEGKSKAEEALNKGASAEEIYALVDTKQSEDDRTQSEDDYLTNLYNKTTANKSAGFSDLR